MKKVKADLGVVETIQSFGHDHLRHTTRGKKVVLQSTYVRSDRGSSTSTVSFHGSRILLMEKKQQAAVFDGTTFLSQI